MYGCQQCLKTGKTSFVVAFIAPRGHVVTVNAFRWLLSARVTKITWSLSLSSCPQWPRLYIPGPWRGLSMEWAKFWVDFMTQPMATTRNHQGWYGSPPVRHFGIHLWSFFFLSISMPQRTDHPTRTHAKHQTLGNSFYAASWSSWIVMLYNTNGIKYYYHCQISLTDIQWK